MTSLFSINASMNEALDAGELRAIGDARKKVLLLLTRYLRLKFGPKKASSKVRKKGIVDNV